jgi:hypothetical protein
VSNGTVRSGIDGTARHCTAAVHRLAREPRPSRCTILVLNMLATLHSSSRAVGSRVG